MDSAEDLLAVQERILKQKFLISEIIDAGYDPMVFKTFCEEIKPSTGTNIDGWTMDELHKLVEEFKDKYVLNDEADMAQEMTQSIMVEKKGNSKIEEKKNEEMLKFKEPEGKIAEKKQDEVLEPISFRKIIKCDKLCSSWTGDVVPEVILKGYEVVAGGIFSSSYVMYSIVTKPFGWEVKRRYSDFHWLRKLLIRIRPYDVVPPIPQKKMKKNFESKHLHKRQVFLERFVNNIMKSPDLCNLKIVQEFLNIADENAFKAKKKEAEKLARPMKLEKVETPEGELEIRIDHNLKSYSNRLGDFLSNADLVYKKIRKLSKQLSNDYDQVSSTMYQIGECFASLYELNNNMNTSISEGKNTKMTDVYVTLNNIFVAWGTTISDQRKFLEDKIGNFFKYHHHELGAFKELLRHRDNQAQEYYKFKEKLTQKKDRLFQQNDVSKWELQPSFGKLEILESLKKNKEDAFAAMLPKETKMESDLRDQFGFVNYKAFKDLGRCLDVKCTAYSSHFTDFAKFQVENLSEMHVIWADVMSHFVDSSGVIRKRGKSKEATDLMMKK